MVAMLLKSWGALITTSFLDRSSCQRHLIPRPKRLAAEGRGSMDTRHGLTVNLRDCDFDVLVAGARPSESGVHSRFAPFAFGKMTVKTITTRTSSVVAQMEP